jgi:hypothetical protein
MKAVFVFLAALLIVAPCLAQVGPDTMWTRTFGENLFGDTLSKVAFSAQQTSDGGYIVAGQAYYPTSPFNYRGFLIKLDGTGSVSWWHLYPDPVPCGNGYEQFGPVQETTDGGYVVVTAYDWQCYPQPTIHGIHLLKMDSMGEIQWTSLFGSRGTAVCEVEDGFLVGGDTPVNQMCVYKTDFAGNVIWERQLYLGDESHVSAVGQRVDGNYFVAGCAIPISFQGHAFVYLTKLTPEGDSLWTRIYTTPVYTSVSSTLEDATETANGGFLLAGYCAPGIFPWVTRTTADGIPIWEWYLGFSTGRVFAAHTLPNGDFILAGSHYLSNYPLWLIRISELGDTLWTRDYGTGIRQSALAVDVTSDGGYLMAGYIRPLASNNDYVYVVKTFPDPLNVPPAGAVSGQVTPATSGLPVNLLDEYGAPISTVYTGSEGDYEFADVSPGSYSVELVVPPGFAVSPNPVAVEVVTGETAVADFAMTALPGTVEGQVTPAYYGIVIDLLAQDGTLVASVWTDESGHYEIGNILAGSYVVELVEPLGFTVDQNLIPVTVVGGDLQDVNFELSTLPTINDARGKGYWKHQVNANLTGHGNTDYTSDQLLDLAELIFNCFYLNSVHPIQVDGVTYVGSPAASLSMEDMRDMLSINQGGSTPYERACSEYLALLLNVVSGKLAQYSQASEDGATVSQAIIFLHPLLTANSELAKEIAETLNSAEAVEAGVIPLETPNIMFGNAGNFNPPYPEPFNPTATFSFELYETMNVRITIYDILGRTVAKLVNERLSVGKHQITFDGSRLPSGMYFANLRAGNYVKTYKMLLLK